MCCVCAALCVWLLRGAGCLLVACGCLLVRACVRVLVGAGGLVGVRCRVLGRCVPLVALSWLAGVGGLVVICIVDASIFVLCVFCWVVLVFWAFGGCLGIRGR